MCSWPKVEALPGALEMMRSIQGPSGITLATKATDSREQEIREALTLLGDDFGQDVTMANAVGIKAVWFNFRNHESRTGADFRTIHEFTELPPILEEWGVLTSGHP